MNTDFKSSFDRAIKKIRDQKIKSEIEKVIENVEKAKSLNEIENLSKLTGYKEYYRIDIGDFRIGLHIAKSLITFVIVANRKDIYKKFP